MLKHRRVSNTRDVSAVFMRSIGFEAVRRGPEAASDTSYPYPYKYCSAKNAFHHDADVVSLARMDSIHTRKLYHNNRKDILLSIQAISLPLIS